MPKAGGKWNVYEITAKGPKFTVILNGQKTVDGAEDGKFASGAIALQYFPGVRAGQRRGQIPQGGDQAAACAHLGDDRGRVVRGAVGGPGDIAVRPHQDQAAS